MFKENQISIIAPSSPPKNKTWRKSLKILKDWGLKVDFSDKSLSSYLFHANTDSKRALFLKKAFANQASSVIWMLRGGYGFQKLQFVFSELVLDFKKTFKKKQTKLFVGYSDGTVLHLYLNAKKKASLHAPTLSELESLSPKEQKTLRSVLLGETQQVVFKGLKVFVPKTLKSVFKKKRVKELETKPITGKITGGNLSLISTSVGTLKLPSTEFLFLEDVHESAYKVDRMLHHLLYSGVLKSTKAILFGDFYPLKNKELQKIFESFSQSSSLPLVWGLPCGHSQRMPLPFNTKAELSLKGKQATLKVLTQSGMAQKNRKDKTKPSVKGNKITLRNTQTKLSLKGNKTTSRNTQSKPSLKGNKTTSRNTQSKPSLKGNKATLRNTQTKLSLKGNKTTSRNTQSKPSLKGNKTTSRNIQTKLSLKGNKTTSRNTQSKPSLKGNKATSRNTQSKPSLKGNKATLRNTQSKPSLKEKKQL